MEGVCWSFKSLTQQCLAWHFNERPSIARCVHWNGRPNIVVETPSYLGFGFSYPLFLKRGLFVNKKFTFVFQIWGLILIPYGFTLSEDRCSWWPRQWLSLYFEKQRRKNYLPIICRAHHDCPIFWKQRRNNLLVALCENKEEIIFGCPYIWKTKKK